MHSQTGHIGPKIIPLRTLRATSSAGMLRGVVRGNAQRNRFRKAAAVTVSDVTRSRRAERSAAVASTPQLPLADDLFLTAHDTVKGKSLLTSATLGLGLAGALLGELVLWRRLDIVDAKIVLIDDRPTGDPAVTAVLDQLLREGHHRAVRDWIAFLATGIATELVERRLSRAGLIQRQEKRGLLGAKVFYVP